MYEGGFKNDQKDGRGVMRGRNNEYFEAHYREGVKHGPYRKTIGEDYE